MRLASRIERYRDGRSHPPHPRCDAEDIDHVCHKMAGIRVRRLPVMNRRERLVGIVSASDLAHQQLGTARTLHGIATPSAQPNRPPARRR